MRTSRPPSLTRVEYASTGLLVKGPKPPWLSRRNGPSIDVTIELPAGSHVRGTGQVADFRCDGRLGECRIKTGLGHIRLDQADALNLKSGIGDISVEHATGHAEITTGVGRGARAQARRRRGDQELERRHVDRRSPTATCGSTRPTEASPSTSHRRASSPGPRTATSGSARSCAARSSLETRLGDLDVGIREGTAAWLDVSSKVGAVHNMLAAGEAPEPSAETVDVRARTSVGEIAIRRP